MKKEILVSVEHDETRGAILEDGRLVDVFIERPLAQRVVGNIYKGRVENVLPGMQAAFVNIGLERNAFLHVDDAHPVKMEGDEDEPPEDLKGKTINDLLRVGQEVVVQVVKEAVGTKGARITRNLTIPGRYLVLMPGVDYVGVSRKISDEAERERLKRIAQSVKPPGLGLIVRTVAEGRSEEDIARDAKFLLRVWSDIQRKNRQQRAPSILYKDMGLVYRLLRDFMTDEVTRFAIDSRAEYQQAQELLEIFAPEQKDRLEFFHGKGRSLFEVYGLNEEIDRALKKRVWLPSGGYIVIDQTEALTVIDVNTGKFVGTHDLQDTVYRTNMEAVDEIARQIRLRDIGGIIVIDFIDMESPRHRHRVVRALERAVARDRTKTTVLGITQLGLVEMTRKKGRKNLLDLLTRECPYCDGRGRVLTEESQARRVRREIKRILRSTNHEAILVEVHPSVASLLIGAGGSNLKELERETGKSIYIKGSEACHIEEMNLRALGSKAEVEEQALPVKAGDVIELKVEEPHVSNSWDGIARVEGYVIDIEGAGNRVGETVTVEITRAFRTYAKARIVQPPQPSQTASR
ncbi:MAG: Rne/Rng family ribonuclease [Thermaerobacter sp.]|nr:ribonuclease G [Bacillota bacterium]REJ37644.1 MAG: ribonuclease G [Bacillota bacterium]